jgi:hypothetical protein
MFIVVSHIPRDGIQRAVVAVRFVSLDEDVVFGDEVAWPEGGMEGGERGARGWRR